MLIKSQMHRLKSQMHRMIKFPARLCKVSKKGFDFDRNVVNSFRGGIFDGVILHMHKIRFISV